MVLPELVSVWLIRFPLPAEKPDIFGELPVAFQVNVVPATCDRIWIFVVCCEQMVCDAGLKYTSGTGKTDTT